MRSPPVRRRLLLGLGLWAVLGWLGLGAAPARAQGVELIQLQSGRSDGALTLEFAARVTLPKAVEDAMARGVPVYFVAQATLRRDRWYWRDERVARVSRSWRVVYQPLTSSWRVGLGGLNQTYATLAEAMAAVTRSAGWRIAELSQLEPGKDYYIEFSWRLDTSQLPSPMQIGLGGQADWAIGAERELPVELP
ncbi:MULTISPECIES: DUF4390 domain-containing protein [Rubrivivax]|uniref:DUF4390 domain-containing protein n=1 Tax=Rubrivivax benzoatilyticus TaxID=316997 RepID=A0ABX0I393_9BURK|nr:MULTISPECIES: DUF4390 domain-containing protein [Rubrivivax]MCD0422389.1 DUF4390 domain-containing protein [Rubrivivax sp. JA1024]EGJ09181.1 hypothetical protein RBXJA2T_02582 [Rubrivivax benzoatilyticus JA2 = ATCC BAA-35]MCC9596520.1 DUF4390 domain-containing protein [Rubrivivax sp. JA1055]MCC9648676.1 DUF4390 domain-containing protein [Rubrivivax sp. JA1029]NHL00060.1 DUF4390 domain-containing protein [Rubrivivax benzoatilyticus]